ncbi:aminotransferase class III-fold pyridoxal phosphate-dependent enzyme [Kiloniella laminariae]|uniref:Aminotransferase class III-fold pyridoxal phosphate-dependent enzyme n=1 Tax=Kiloniella laminariae TaxID=454162 RepID=A0ABT4LDJ8_9PROT|nr:aminotransferase class III-fold pyridoxal phosphate-dependent enzyme [Kiloniella laminariae]MCZ4279175.1 aminotransferase class III-fold pyridoxal phosphate-dependent enzyme [Kiloniella laminariae]
MAQDTLHLYSAAEAECLFQELYGPVGRATALPSERDQNFKLVVEGEGAFVLKLYAPETDRIWLEAQDALLQELAERDADLPLPRVVPNNKNKITDEVLDPSGKPRPIRLLSWMEGEVWNKAAQKQDLDYSQIGQLMGRMDKALKSFGHEGANRTFLWDIAQAVTHRAFLHLIDDEKIRSIVTDILDRFEQENACALNKLPSQVIHNDANDYNILVDKQGQISGLIDFGDFINSYRVCDLAVACAYAMLGQRDPVGRACDVVSGYHRVNPLTAGEIALVYDLVQVRLAESVCMAAQQYAANPENEYLLISQKDVRELLIRMEQINREVVHYRFRDVCGLEACPGSRKLVQWLSANADQIGPICDPALSADNVLVLDLSTLSVDEEGKALDAEAATNLIFSIMEEAGAEVGIGNYLEDRNVYKGDFFETVDPEERRTVHLGIDLFLPAYAPLYAPLDGKVRVHNDNTRDYDYGPVVILEHETDEGQVFYTKYGHLSRTSLALWEGGKAFKKGELIGYVGPYPENGNWAPHVHFQLLLDLMGMENDVCGVAARSERNVWASVCPSPNLILGMQIKCEGTIVRSARDIRSERARHLGPNLSLSYRAPLKIVRGEAQFLYSDSGDAYLDMVNNVCHVGHCHPRVVKAATSQLPVLNTNTRYLHDNIVNYARELLSTFPEPLEVCFFVNSGSEANDLALRLAQNYTGSRDMLVVDHAYHGNLTSLIDLSPYKFNRKGGKGRPEHVRVCPMPDGYRGPVKASDPDCGDKYADMAIRELRALEQAGGKPCAFIAESLLGCGGQIVLPQGYLPKIYQAVRASGGLCIADEVQVGFGRIGEHMWGFEQQGVVPDIVTLGKPIANGHPMGAVVTTRAVADAFVTGMEYFNTFGGNPVSCAIGLEVLQVVRDERLQNNARRVGERMMQGLRRMVDNHPLIGEVRGMGLFIGVELVQDHDTLEPATLEAGKLVNLMKECGILLSTDGPLDNVVKIKPPICFSADDAERFLREFDRCLALVEQE